ncbi:MAG: sigma-70 family RNA polymerase sigma factor [Hyphomicrobiaceae bacterium]|nr:sigma-70 family RNA polymerase sigma factor [Hyphomicrobiaceae bacterium]
MATDPVPPTPRTDWVRGRRGLCFWLRRMGTSGRDMADFLKRIAEGADEAAFRELYQTYGPRVKAYMMRQGADPAAAEDLAQETLLTVWRRAGLYAAEKGSATTWIFTIARNLRIDRLRREVAWQELPQDLEREAADEPQPDEAYASQQSGMAVREALSALPEEQRQVVVLAYVEGLSHSEIAARLGLPIGTVKSRMRIAYDKVRAALEGLQS